MNLKNFGNKIGEGDSMTHGFVLSAIFHVILLGLVILGLPIFWEPEPLPETIGIELATLSDITAAPKVDKAGKPEKKPKTEPAKETLQKPKPEPAKPNPPAPSAPPAPTPPAPSVVPEKPLEQKKPEEKKPEPPVEKPKKPEKPEKKPEKKQSEEELDNLLQNVLKDNPAPETPEKPKKKAESAPAPEVTGPQTSNISEIPMTASEEDGIRAQVEKNWNLGSAIGSPNLAGMVVELRIELLPDGTVTKVTVLTASSDPFFRSIAESARRAVLISSPLKLPPGKSWPTMLLRFYPDQAVQ